MSGHYERFFAGRGTAGPALKGWAGLVVMVVVKGRKMVAPVLLFALAYLRLS